MSNTFMRYKEIYNILREKSSSIFLYKKILITFVLHIKINIVQSY